MNTNSIEMNETMQENVMGNPFNLTLLQDVDTSKLPKSLLKIRAQIAMLTKQTIQHKRDLMATCAELRTLETMMDKHILQMAKKESKTRTKRPSGFATPVPMMPEIAEFMGVEMQGTISRTEATKVINKYIETRKLQCANNKKTFIPDGALMKLLQVTTPEPIAYFDIQRKLNVYFNPKPPADTQINSPFGMSSEEVSSSASAM